LIYGNFLETAIPRNKRVNVENLVRNRSIPIIPYFLPDKSSLSQLHFKPIADFNTAYVLLPSLNLDLAWYAGLISLNDDEPRPNWSGFMQHYATTEETFKSSADIRMLLIIDMNPNDLSCISSTLLFIERQAVPLNIQTACVRFDQPLWLKTVDIVHSNNMIVVCRLGGFHVIMSFLGSIGRIMAGSGMIETMQSCCKPHDYR